MAKGKGSNRSKSKPSAKVDDMKAKKNPKGGALNAYLKYDSKGIKIEGTPTVDVSSLNFLKYKK